MKVIFAFLSITACWAQQPEFEVATIKPSPPPSMGRMMMGMRGGPGTDDPGRFTCTNCTLMMLITNAYDVQRFQVSGPPTLESDRFEVVAKVPQGATKEQFHLMMQKLLADRFQLKLHHDTKEMPVYDLVVAKGGPKLKESAATPQEPGPQTPQAFQEPKMDKDGYPVPRPGRGGIMQMSPRGARMVGSQDTMEELAKGLSMIVGRPVKDATGLTGKYDYKLSFVPDMGRGMMGGGMPPRSLGADGPGPGPGGGPGPVSGAPDETGPTIFTALQEQLGLKLDAKKGPVDMLVIDHVEKTPTEND